MSIAKPGAIAPTPASRQGPWFPPVVGGNSIVCYVLVDCNEPAFVEPNQASVQLEQLRNRQFGDCIGQSVEVLRTAPEAQDDLNNYGPELINVTQRAALQAVAPHLQNLESQNVALRQRLAVEARHRLDQRVERAVPDYREIDQDPRWHRWLLSLDPLSGCARQQLLNQAIVGSDANRVISFFRGFLQVDQATGQASSAASGRARSPNKPVYTRAQIAQLYSLHRCGAYARREAEWARQEADFYTAQREGRVLSGFDSMWAVSRLPSRGQAPRGWPPPGLPKAPLLRAKLPKQAANPQKPGSTALMMSRAVLPVRNAHPAAPSMVFRLFHDLYHIQIVTGAFVPYEVVVPTVEPGSIVVMPPDTGNMISFIRFRLGTKSQPIVQTSMRKFQIVLDVPAA